MNQIVLAMHYRSEFHIYVDVLVRVFRASRVEAGSFSEPHRLDFAFPRLENELWIPTTFLLPQWLPYCGVDVAQQQTGKTAI